MANGMVKLSPMVTVKGEVNMMALAQQKSEMKLIEQFITINEINTFE